MQHRMCNFVDHRLYGLALTHADLDADFFVGITVISFSLPFDFIHDVILHLAVACDGERDFFFLGRFLFLDHLCRFLHHFSGVHKGKGRGRKAHCHQQGQNCAGDNNSQPFKHTEELDA